MRRRPGQIMKAYSRPRFVSCLIAFECPVPSKLHEISLGGFTLLSLPTLVGGPEKSHSKDVRVEFHSKEVVKNWKLYWKERKEERKKERKRKETQNWYQIKRAIVRNEWNYIGAESSPETGINIKRWVNTSVPLIMCQALYCGLYVSPFNWTYTTIV